MTRTVARWAILIALLALTAGGCGLPEDGQPRPLAADAVAPLSSPEAGNTGVTPVSGDEWIVYVVETEPTADPEAANRRLFPLPSTGEGVPTPADLVEQLLSTREDSLRLSGNPNLSNQIPPETALVSYQLNEAGDTAILTLSGEFANVQGPAQKLAVAQLVFTATEVGGVPKVQFRVGEDPDDSDPVPVVAGPDDELKTIVTREDYENFKPELDE